jgi:hypothetical protein
MEHNTYIRVYGAMKSPHLLPRFVPDKLVLLRSGLSNGDQWSRGMLYRDKKAIWPPLPLYIDTYLFSNTKKIQEEVDILLSYHFGEERFRRHDPKKVIKEHFNKLGVPWEYTS